jgi:hypothetical protein
MSIWSTQIALERTGNWWGRVVSGAGDPSEGIKKDIINFLESQ